jgi:CheY-like chemotaxis protein
VLNATAELMMPQDKLLHVLLNLLDNAMKHTKAGLVEVRVSVRSKANIMDIAVVDTGHGISESDIGKLFTLYQVLDVPSKMHSSGSGLGLVIAKRFCELLHGGITVSSKEGRGSTFSFHFSYQVPVASIQPPASTGCEPIPAQLTGRRVLVVDDNSAVRAMIRRVLSSEGCIVLEAEDGLQAVRAVRAAVEGEKLDAVLLDCIMPVMDGFEAARIIRQDISQQIPIIALTGSHVLVVSLLSLT